MITCYPTNIEEQLKPVSNKVNLGLSQYYYFDKFRRVGRWRKQLEWFRSEIENMDFDNRDKTVKEDRFDIF